MRVCPRCRSVYCTDVWVCSLDGERLRDHPRDPLVGGAIERYVVLDLIGQGAMGRVYRARHAVLDRAYAIKVLFGEYAADPKFQERFRQEALSISQIRHPSIVSVEDFGTTPEGLAFLVLELVEGRPLDQVIEREAPMSPRRVVHIAMQLAAGLGAAHAHGFVHRDVKPSNVMVLPQGPPPPSPNGAGTAPWGAGGDVVKLLDFGAVSLLAVPRDQRLTRMGHLIGTPTYMAPEQSQDPGVGPSADLYALGVMMFEMLTGEPPFRGAHRTEIIVQHISAPPPPLPPLGGLERIVALLLEKDPRDRPQNAKTLLSMLTDLPLLDARREGPPSVARRPATGDLEIIDAGFPALSDDPLEPGDWSDWAREASIEPYTPPPLGPAGSDDANSSDRATRRDALARASSARGSPAGAEAAVGDSFGTSLEQALAKNLTVDEAALLFEPAMPSERKMVDRDDGATQVDFLVGEHLGSEARTELELPPEVLDGPLEPIAPPEPLPSLFADRPDTPPRAPTLPPFRHPQPSESLEALFLSDAKPSTLLDDLGRGPSREAPWASSPLADLVAVGEVRKDEEVRPRVRVEALRARPATERRDASPRAAHPPTRSTGGLGPLDPSTAESLPGLRASPGGAAQHPLAGIDAESTSAVPRRAAGRRRTLGAGGGLLERLLLPLTLVVLSVAAAVLTGALLLRTEGRWWPSRDETTQGEAAKAIRPTGEGQADRPQDPAPGDPDRGEAAPATAGPALESANGPPASRAEPPTPKARNRASKTSGSTRRAPPGE